MTLRERIFADVFRDKCRDFPINDSIEYALQASKAAQEAYWKDQQEWVKSFPCKPSGEWNQ